MNLPRQNLPIFELIVPSTKQRIQYRQFTVKEEKMLIQAKELEDTAIIVNAVVEVIQSCLKDKIDIEGLTLFDVEYIITKIRAKSVGEALDLNMQCDKDSNHKRTLVRIDLDKAEIKYDPTHSLTIPLYDDVVIKMKYPTLRDALKHEKLAGLDSAIMCIDAIYTKDEVYDAKEQSREELIGFLDDLTQEQLDKIDKTFFKTIPVFEYWFTYKCAECGHEHKKVIRGLSNFFV